MSAADKPSPNVSSQDNSKPLSTPPRRPSLRQPPPRPESQPAKAAPPAASKAIAPPAAAPTVPSAAVADTPSAVPPMPNHPIAPPSEPMQYRAIGLVKGTYHPSEEQLNRGNIVTDDGVVIDSVLLGRVTSLIKKHLDLESSHLWVVYPRTRQGNGEDEGEEAACGLHLQIVGVWEPDTLGLPGENPKTKAKAAAASSDAEDSVPDKAAPAAGDQNDSALTAADMSAAVPEATAEIDDVAAGDPPPLPSENYFSIRGEVLNYEEDSGNILIKIVQGAKRSGKPPKAFKLNVFGNITGKILGYFWEFDIERQGEKLIVTDGRSIRMVPPKKKKKGGRPSGVRRGSRPGGPSGKPKPSRNTEKPRIRPSAPVKSNPL
ncbi:MAG: hypothetical protein ACFBSG_07070 [Leptolyngbyaceae cyanobacterium]